MAHEFSTLKAKRRLFREGQLDGRLQGGIDGEVVGRLQRRLARRAILLAQDGVMQARLAARVPAAGVAGAHQELAAQRAPEGVHVLRDRRGVADGRHRRVGRRRLVRNGRDEARGIR